MRYVLGACAAFLAVPVWALSCAPLPERVQQQAAPSRTVTRAVAECKLENASALMVQARVDSLLVRARASLSLSFADAGGRELDKRMLPPLVGQFRDLPLAQPVRVPGGAVVVRLLAQVESRSTEGSGTVDWRQLRVTAMPDLDLELAGDGVLAASQPVVVTLKGQDLPAGAVPVLRILNLEGQEVRRIDGAPHDSRWTLPPLPAGYYDVRLELGGAAPLSLQQGLAIIPPGEAPRDRRFGLDTALSWYGGDIDTVRRQLSLMRLAGVGSVRDRFSWTQVQKQPDSNQWDRYTTTARELQRSGFDVVQVFHDAPVWARVPGAASTTDRAAPTADAAFGLGQAYAREMGQWAPHVEFWNEQNGPFFVGYPFEYAAALKAFRAGARSVNPALDVLLGSAAGRPGPFFDELARNEVVAAIDRGNHHFYGKVDDLLQLPAEDRASPGRPRWLTEIGYSLRRDAAGDWRAAERSQAVHLVKAYALGFAAGYERVFYFLLRELIEDDYHTWGIVHADLSPRPAFVSLACLTRHLAGAVPGALLQQKGVTALYFRLPQGEWRAVAWGRGSRVAAGGGASVSDAWCRPLAKDRATSDEPVLLAGIKRLPAGARPLPAAPAPTVVGVAPVRLSALLAIDGNPPPRTGNAAALAVSAGQQLQWQGRILRDGPVTRDAVLECRAGPGVVVTGSTRMAVEHEALNGARWACAYDIQPLNGPSWIEVSVEAGTARDQLHLALQPDLRQKTRRVLAGATLLPVDVCRNWDRNAAPSLKLDLQVRRSPAGCRGVEVRSDIVKAGEAWVFPGTPLAPGALGRAQGVRLQVAALEGLPLPPRPMLLQLAEKNGGIWLIELQRDDAAGSGAWSGLFDSARPAAWARDPDGHFDPANVTRLMVGWGGYGGQPGQSHGFRLESLLLIPASAPEKSVHAADS